MGRRYVYGIVVNDVYLRLRVVQRVVLQIRTNFTTKTLQDILFLS